MGPVRFSISTAFLPTDQLVPIAKAADELGYDSLAMPDHVVDLETLRTPYPYTPDGARRWGPEAEWPDPWVLAGALSTVTTRLRFFTSVYVPALRNPFQVAKSVGTAAVISGNRVALGVGIGWCEEEFELLEQSFRTRGKRTDEGLALIKELWQPGWREFHGEFYDAPRLTMEPTPTAPIPIYVGGLSEIAFARAARHDGWVGDMYPTDEAIRWATRLAEVRAEAGRGCRLLGVRRAHRRVPARALRARRGGRRHRLHDDAMDVLLRPRRDRRPEARGHDRGSPRT